MSTRADWLEAFLGSVGEAQSTAPWCLWAASGTSPLRFGIVLVRFMVSSVSPASNLHAGHRRGGNKRLWLRGMMNGRQITKLIGKVTLIQ